MTIPPSDDLLAASQTTPEPKAEATASSSGGAVEDKKTITISKTFRKISDAVKVSDAKIDTAIDSAWRRFNAYDKQAARLKTRYLQFRLYIILASFATTVVAVLDSQAESDTFLKDLLQVSLILLPLLSAAILTFAARFESGIAWVGYRGAAETVKRGIYELRVRRSMTFITQDDIDKLREVVKHANAHLDEMGVTTPLFVDSIDETNPDSSELAKPNYVDMPGKDDGYAPIELDAYIKWRILPQAEWYGKRAVRDYNRTRQYRALILGVSILGPVLAYFGLGVWVAVTVAGIAAISAYLALKQFEQNYGVYNKTARQLEDLVNDYRVKSEGMKLQDKLMWLGQIENVIGGEREVWQLSVLRGQAATEEALNQLVNKATGTVQKIVPEVADILDEDEEDDDEKAPKSTSAAGSTAASAPRG